MTDKKEKRTDYVRVNMILYPEHIEALDKIGRLANKNRSEIIRELLDESIPAFGAVIQAYDKLAAMQEAQRQKTLDALEEFQLELENLGIDAIDRFKNMEIF